jgi:DUF4097 and DUF4098 domain-containing protein YvlB
LLPAEAAASGCPAGSDPHQIETKPKHEPTGTAGSGVEHTQESAMQKIFDTPGPISLYVELGSGDLALRAADVAETTVSVDGKHADEVTVEQRGDQIVVLAPKRTGFLSNSGDLSVHVTLPTDSHLTTKFGSADLDASGRLGDVKIKTGSGDIRFDELGGDAVIDSGSGDITISSVTGDVRVKTGSGDIEIDNVDGVVTITTGSGDVAIGTASRTVDVKSGSGDMRVREAADNVSLSTASGDLVVDRMQRGQLLAKNVSGDIKVGIPANVPVWTDISSVTGQVYSDLQGAGEPEKGQDFIEIRAKTVSGDIALEEL